MGMGGNEASGPSLFGRTIPAKRIRPRLVLGLLGGGSFAGIWVAHLGDPLLLRVLLWSLVVTLGLLIGGLYWRVVLFDPAVFGSPDGCRYVRKRWRRVEGVAVLSFFLSGVASLALGVGQAPLGVGAVALGIGLVSGPLLWVGIRRYAVDDPARQKTALRAAVLLVLLVSLAGFARIETGATPTEWVVRLGHLGAFSLWVGGAVWHNFVILPTMRSRPDAGKALKSQARTFRRHLPVVIALLLVTGLYQTDRLVGLSVPALFGSRVGYLVGFKLVVVSVLTGLVIASLRRSG